MSQAPFSVMPPADHRPLVAAQRRERMRARLLSAALALAAEGGIASVTIDAVIARAGVARGTFYKYFDTPADLFQEVGSSVADALIRAMNPFMMAMDDPAARISAGIRTVLRLARRYPQIGSFMVRSGWPAMDTAHAFFTLVGKNLTDALQAGRFARMPGELAIGSLAGITIGAMHAISSSPMPDDFPEQTAATVLRALGLTSDEAGTISRAELDLPELDLASLMEPDPDPAGTAAA